MLIQQMIQRQTFTGANGRESLYELSQETENKELIVFVHGFMGFMDWGAWHLVRDFFTGAGYDFCRFNISHNGTSPDFPLTFADLGAFGQNTYSYEVTDVLRLVKHLESKHGTWDRIHLIGHSRGGGTALLASEQWQFQSQLGMVCTWAGICDIARRFPTGAELLEWEKNGIRFVRNARTNQDLPQQYTLYTDFIAQQEKLDILSAAKKMAKHLHIFHGDQDSSVPLSEADELAKASGTNVCQIKGADHVFGAQHPWNEKKMPPLLLELCVQSLEKIRHKKSQ